MADQALALIPPSTRESLRAEMLLMKAEVLRLAGARQEAADCLAQALDFYTERHVVPLAEQTRAALASLGAQPR